MLFCTAARLCPCCGENLDQGSVEGFPSILLRDIVVDGEGGLGLPRHVVACELGGVKHHNGVHNATSEQHSLV